MLGNRKEVEKTYTLDQLIDELQGFFSFEHNYIPVYSYKKQELLKADLGNVLKLESFLIELERDETKGNINNVLD
ncbi:MAG: hypothetical protein Q9M97_06740 [Candidatus Gracilibacteria bacterium]|nr:hypothetical protein [Candidatus Gracilibacteria bacterium]